MDESLSLQKKQEELHQEIDTSLVKQKQELAGWMQDVEKQEQHLSVSRQKMESINKEYADSLRNFYGVTEAVPLHRTTPKQTVPAAKYWWLSRHSEKKRLAQAKKKYGEQISVNSIREQRDMEDYEKIRSDQMADYDDTMMAYCKNRTIAVKKTALSADNLLLDVKIDGYEEMVKRQKLRETRPHYLGSDELEKGLIPFFAMQKRRWLFFKKTVGVLGNESSLERKDPAAYNKKLMERYTKSKAGSEERMKVLDTLRVKIQTFRITPKMLTDGYLADHSIQLRRYADMTKAFRILIATNPGYLEKLSEEDRTMLGNTLNYTGPLIQEFLDRHQACKHLKKHGQRTVFSVTAEKDLSEQNEEVRKEIWEKIHAADTAEQAAIGLKNRHVLKHMEEMEEEAEARRAKQEEKEKRPDYAITLKYDTSGYSEDRLLDFQNRMRDKNGAYDLIGDDMEKLFGQYAKSMATLDTLKARSRALQLAIDDTKNALKKDKNNRRYNGFLEYAEKEIKTINQDKALMETTVDQYELALEYVTGIRLSDEDMTIPPIEEKYRDVITNVFKEEKLSFLLNLSDCRFYAKEFAELTGGEFHFREVMKDAVARGRSEEMKLHASRLKELEEEHRDHQLTQLQILSLRPEDLEKYNFNGYTDQKGVRHHGAHDLSDEVNFKHMKELASIANMDIKGAREALKKTCEDSGNSKEETEERLLKLETKYELCKDYYHKWEGTYQAIKTQSFRFLPQIPDMEGQNGIFQDPHVFEKYKEDLQRKLEQKKAAEPESPDIARYEDMIALMNGMLIRNGLLFEGEEDIKLLDKETFDAKYRQLRYEKRMKRALKVFTDKEVTAAESKRFLKKADDALFYEDQYAELTKTHGKQLDRNLMEEELNRILEKKKTKVEKDEAKKEFLAKKGVAIMELRSKLTPEFFTEDYIRNHFQEFAETVLTLRDFAKIANSDTAFQMMMEGLSDKTRDDVADAVDVMLHVESDLRLLLYSVFSANNVDYNTGQIDFKTNIVKDMLEILPDDEFAKKYQEARKGLETRKKEREENPEKRPTWEESKQQMEKAKQGIDARAGAMLYESELAEDYLDKNLTLRLQKLRDHNFIEPERKNQLLFAKSPTEELYQYLYKDKVAGELSLVGAKGDWNEVLDKAMADSKDTFFHTALSKEARDVAKEMKKDRKKIEDYLQWKVRHDARVYMNERSRLLGVKESQEDTNMAYEIMDAMEETHSSVHNSVNRKMRTTLFPELEKKGIDPEQFMHLLRIVHRTGSGMAGRLVDISNQSANMDRMQQYLDPDSQSDFILQATTEVMKIEIKGNMLSEEYLKEPGNFRYMYFVAQKLKAYEQLYKKDRASIEKALKEDSDHKELFEKVEERFGTFYGNVSDHVYRMVMNFAAKYGVDEKGVRSFGLSAEEYEQLTEEGKKSGFAAKSKKNMKAADEKFQKDIAEIRRSFAARQAAGAAIRVIRDYNTFETEKWLKKDAEKVRIEDLRDQDDDEEEEMVNREAAIYKQVSLDKIAEDGKAIVNGMEKAITLKDAYENKEAKKKVALLDSRFRVGDVAYFLPPKYYETKMRKNKKMAERDAGVHFLVDLFSGNPVQQMNFLLEDGRLEEIVGVFKKHEDLTANSRKDLYSEDYLASNFTGELFLDAQKMAVYSLLPEIIGDFFPEESLFGEAKESFLDKGSVSEETVKKSEIYTRLQESIKTRERQNEMTRANAEALSKDGQIGEEELKLLQGDMKRLERENEFAETDRDHLLPKLKTEEQKNKVRELLKELQQYIGTKRQREFYKNYANNLKLYVRICGVNTDSPDNSLGSVVSGMGDGKLDMAFDSMKVSFEKSQNMVKDSMGR